MTASNPRLIPTCLSNFRKICLSPSIHMKSPGEILIGSGGSSVHPLDQSQSRVPYWLHIDHCPLSLTSQSGGNTTIDYHHRNGMWRRWFPQGGGASWQKQHAHHSFCWFTNSRLRPFVWSLLCSRAQHWGFWINLCWVMSELPSLWTIVLFFYWMGIIIYLLHMVGMWLRKTVEWMVWKKSMTNPPNIINGDQPASAIMWCWPGQSWGKARSHSVVLWSRRPLSPPQGSPTLLGVKPNFLPYLFPPSYLGFVYKTRT